MNFVSTHDEKSHFLVVVSKKFPAEGVVEFELTSAEGSVLPEWEPGAHIDLHLESGLVRQYSLMRGIISDQNWRIAVLIEESGKGGSKFLNEHINVGSIIRSVGPRNHFKLIDAKKYLFIAGGIGITPLIPMIEQLEKTDANWRIAYLGRSLTSMAYAAELSSKYGAKVTLFPKSEGKFFDVADSISQLTHEEVVYSCGPEKLVNSIEHSMRGMIDNLHVERFHPREIVLSKPDTEFIVYCQKSDVELVVPPDESILMTADFEGIEIPGDCMEGTCGSCETRVIEGEVDHRDSVLSPKERAEGETMMICVSRAKGNRLVIDL